MFREESDTQKPWESVILPHGGRITRGSAGTSMERNTSTKAGVCGDRQGQLQHSSYTGRMNRSLGSPLATYWVQSQFGQHGILSHKTEKKSNWVWWSMSAILGLGRWKQRNIKGSRHFSATEVWDQDHQRFNEFLSYRSLRPNWDMWDLVSK